MFFTYFHVKTQKPSPLSNAIYTCQKDQNTNYVFIYTQTSNLIIFFIWREYSSVNATTVKIFHLSCFIIIHISPYLYHSDAWPLSHFLTKTHICLVLQSIQEYFVLFWVMYYHLADMFFLSHERISILCCLYSKIAGNIYVYHLLWHGGWLIVQNVHCVWRNHTIWMGWFRIVKKTRTRNSRLQLALAVTLWWKVQYSILQSMQAKNCGTLFTV